MARRSLLLVLLAGCGAAAQPPSNNPANASVAIKVDQVGYLPGEAKLAMVTASDGGGSSRCGGLLPGPLCCAVAWGRP